MSTKVHLVKAMVFLVVMCGCESWTIKKAEHWRIDAFELWYWRRPLRVPWTARKSNQSILKEISPEYSLEGLMLKLKLQYFGHLMQRTDSLEKTLMLGKIEGSRRRGWPRMMVEWHHWLDEHEFEQALGVGDGQGGLVCCSLWGHKELDTTEWLNWTELSAKSCLTFVTPRTESLAGNLCPCDFLGKNIGVGCHFPSPGYLPDPGIEPVSPALQGDSLLLSHQGSRWLTLLSIIISRSICVENGIIHF